MSHQLSRRELVKLGCTGLFVLAAGTGSGCGTRSGSSPDDSLFLAELEEEVADLTANSPAAKWIAQRVVEMRKHLYVYKDFGSGENCFTQRLWMSEPNTPPAPSMSEDAANRALLSAGAGSRTQTAQESQGSQAKEAIPDTLVPTAESNEEGIKGIYAHMSFRDFPWGGYLFLNQTDVEQTPNAGVNLEGAEALVFKARSAQGSCRVEFFMGGFNNEWRSTVVEDLRDSADRCSTGTVTLTEEWQELSINLRGVNLSRIICGFGWAAYHRENSGTEELAFYVDDIAYRYPAPRNQALFIESYAPLPSNTRGFELNSAAYTYDNAVACIALLAVKQNFAAQLIADALCFAVDNDYLFTDGRLRNAYSAGDPESFPGWTNAEGTAYTRLSGHWDVNNNRYVEDLYMSSSSTGVLGWALLALCQAHEQCPKEDRYLLAATKLANLLLTFKDEAGGFTAGFEVFNSSDGAEGETGVYEQVKYKSTEHNITLTAAFKMFARLAKQAQANTYLAASEHARAFVLSLYDAQSACFNLGVGTTGEVDGAIIPLDAQTWGMLVLGNDFAERAAVLTFMQEHLAVEDGFDFSLALSNSKQRGIWTEGTAQALLCYVAAQDEQRAVQLGKTLTRLSNPDGSIDATDATELFTGLYLAGSGAAWIYPHRRHLGATAWKAFAELRVNPFIPLAEQTIG